MKSTHKVVRLLFGGTFDPVHRGHIEIAKDGAKKVQADYIHFIPCFMPVHRDTPTANACQRLDMLKIALQHEPKMIVDERELLRDGPSYTIDTLQCFKQQYPNDVLVFLLGADSWNGFHQWYQWQKFTDFCHLLIAKRPNYSLESDGEVVKWSDKKITGASEEIINNSCGKILLAEMSLLPISATQVRDSILKQESTQHLITPEVASYIKQQALYQRGNL
jgi:nicotinate-nucleotide adenylyltransferase